MGRCENGLSVERCRQPTQCRKDGEVEGLHQGTLSSAISSSRKEFSRASDPSGECAGHEYGSISVGIASTLND